MPPTTSPSTHLEAAYVHRHRLAAVAAGQAQRPDCPLELVWVGRLRRDRVEGQVKRLHGQLRRSWRGCRSRRGAGVGHGRQCACRLLRCGRLGAGSRGLPGPTTDRDDGQDHGSAKGHDGKGVGGVNHHLGLLVCLVRASAAERTRAWQDTPPGDRAAEEVPAGWSTCVAAGVRNQRSRAPARREGGGAPCVQRARGLADTHMRASWTDVPGQGGTGQPASR